MISKARKETVFDPLYGSVYLGAEISDLIYSPIIQRLRHIRLSNIDSLDIPSISNLSRFEHVVGVAYLSSEIGLQAQLKNIQDFVSLQATALLHDWAITSYGHLVEEALQYVGTQFDHEDRLYDIVSSTDLEEVGGVDMQILCGRETGLGNWIRRTSQDKAHVLRDDIVDGIRGQGKWGPIIAGDIDLDNVDNVFRMAYHMGLPIDRGTPIRLARAIVDVDVKRRKPIFLPAAEQDIENWRETRRQVYQRLMLSRRDFIGKVMLLSATVDAYEAGQLSKQDWSLIDCQFLQGLLTSTVRSVRETAERWITGELWDCTPLRWMSGIRPDYPALRSFSSKLTNSLQRQCFAYGIKDKRDRRLEISFSDGFRREYGNTSELWLLGIGSPKKGSFTAQEIGKAFDMASDIFDTKIISEAEHSELQGCLF